MKARLHIPIYLLPLLAAMVHAYTDTNAMATLHGLVILAWYFIAALVIWLLQLYLVCYWERLCRQRHAEYLHQANRHLQHRQHHPLVKTQCFASPKQCFASTSTTKAPVRAYHHPEA